MNHPGGSYLVAVLAIASTGLTVQHDRPQPAMADPATPHAGNAEGDDRATPEIDERGAAGPSVEALAMHWQPQEPSIALHRVDAAAGGDPDFAASGAETLPIREHHLQIINDLRWQGAQAP